jgi:site-specific DNA-methyltransferase (adenine-specific)
MNLYNDDCFNVFPKIKDKTINLFLLDLPYGQTACKWDSVIDLDKMWIEVKRMMKPNGIIVFFCTAKFGNTLINSNPKWFAYDLIWKKSKKVGFFSTNYRELRQHENIYIFKNKQGAYNAQMTPRDKDYKHSGKRSSEKHYSNLLECKKLYKKEDGMHPTSIIENTLLEYNNPTKSIHPTQKPVELCEYLINTYSNEDDVVMDFTMGSGTTGIACSNTNREFIGVEMDKEIFDIAEKRILEHLT